MQFPDKTWLHAADTVDADTTQNKLSMKLAVLGISLCMQAEDAPDCQQVKLSIGNAILLMRRALDTEVLGRQEMPVVHTDLSLTAVSLLVQGSGDTQLTWSASWLVRWLDGPLMLYWLPLRHIHRQHGPVGLLWDTCFTSILHHGCAC